MREDVSAQQVLGSSLDLEPQGGSYLPAGDNGL